MLVCDNSWDNRDAAGVVCRQLGFSSTDAMVFGNARFDEGTGPILLDEMNCVGIESRLVDSPARPLGDHNCGHNEDAGVRCPAI